MPRLSSYGIYKMFIVLIIFVSILLLYWRIQKPSTVLNIYGPIEVLPFQLDMFPIKIRPRPWYLTNGTAFPKPATFSKQLGRRNEKLLPFEDPGSDRIENQLMFIPPNYHDTHNANKTKIILLYSGLDEWRFNLTDRNIPTWFSDAKCPVNRCKFTTNRNDTESADFILFSKIFKDINVTRTPNQIYAFYRFESPLHQNRRFSKSIIYNWTISYRHDSTISVPYSKWIYYEPKITQKLKVENFAQNRTKKVAWLVSNCYSDNDRYLYVLELRKFIHVDVYGTCGTHKCPDTFHDHVCIDQFSKDYKFYLSFENSNCADYITEKVYRNALNTGMIPVVMGARREDYERQLPAKSFIYVEDFASPKDLAEYLQKVDNDNDLFNSYFQWRGTGELVNPFTHLWCRVCALLHDEYTMNSSTWYNDINKWWFNPYMMRRGLWRDIKT